MLVLACWPLVLVAAHVLFPSQSFATHQDFFVELGRQHDDWGFSNSTPFGPALVLLSHVDWWTPWFSVMVVPVLLGAASVATLLLVARELGASRWEQSLTGAALLLSPYVGRVTSSLHSSLVELLLWSLAGLSLTRLLRGASRWWWLALGGLIGLGMLNKQTILLLAAGIAVGVLATPARAQLKTRWPWLALLLAVAVSLPYLVWQGLNGWPVFSYVAEQRQSGIWGGTTQLARVAGQVFAINPGAVPLVLAGLWFLLVHPGGRPFRALGVLFLVVQALLGIAGGKVIYGMPAYVLVVPAGARLVGGWARGFRGGRWLVAAAVAVLVGSGALLAPLSYPILSPAKTDQYIVERLPLLERIGGARFRSFAAYCTEGYLENLTRRIAAAIGDLPSEVRRDCLVFTPDPMVTAGVNHYGAALGLPRAYADTRASLRSGPGAVSGNTLIAFGMPEALLQALYVDVRVVESIPSWTQACGDKRQAAVDLLVCRQLRHPWRDAWPVLMISQHNRLYPEGPPAFLMKDLAEVPAMTAPATASGQDAAPIGQPEGDPRRVRLVGGRLQVEGAIGFQGSNDELTAGSRSLVDDVAALLRSRPELGPIEIRVVADEPALAQMSRSAYNEYLSRLRAEAIRTRLIARGVPGDRLRAVGLGVGRMNRAKAASSVELVVGDGPVPRDGRRPR